MEAKPITRPTAIKILLGEINSGSYIEEDEQSFNYLLTLDQRKIYRFNIMAVVIDKQKQGTITNFLLDDNTGQMIMRTFEESRLVNELNVGEAILILGKVRKYSQEKYLSPDIIKKINPLWLKARSLELKDKIVSITKLSEIKITSNLEPEISQEILTAEIPKKKPLLQSIPTSNETNFPIEEEIIEEEIIEEEIVGDSFKTLKNEDLPTRKILDLIKELDKSNGASIEEILEKSSLNDAEKILQKMLEKGDIFQNLPGRVKVL